MRTGTLMAICFLLLGGIGVAFAAPEAFPSAGLLKVLAFLGMATVLVVFLAELARQLGWR